MNLLPPQKGPVLTTPIGLERSINSLSGILEGIAIDGVINPAELGYLHRWIEDHAEVNQTHPFDQLMPVVEAAVADGILAEEERADIVWLCEKLRSTEFHSKASADIQRLHAIIGGIVADGVIRDPELAGLSLWIQEHEHLRACWPYDELDSLLTAMMREKTLNRLRHQLLMDYFTKIATESGASPIEAQVPAPRSGIEALYALCPEIRFKESRFCFAGNFKHYSASERNKLVERLGGVIVASLSASVDYLVVGSRGGASWPYVRCGRKVERAVELRRQGAHVLLIHEHDFRDALADLV